MSLRQKSLAGMAWSFTETIGVKVFSISVYFILAKLLGPESFGLIALTSTFVLISSIIIDQGFVQALIQKKDLNNQHLDSAFWGLMALAVIFFFLMFFSAPFISQIYEEPKIELILKVFALNFIISSPSLVPRAILERNMDFKDVAIGRITGILLGGMVSIVLAFLGAGVWSLVIQQLIFSFIQNAFIWYKSPWKPGFYFSWLAYKGLFSFGFKVLIIRMVGRSNQYLFDLIIGYFLGTTILGYYSFASKIYMTVSDVTNLTVSRVLLPVFSNNQENKAKLKDFFYRFASKFFYPIAMLLTLLFLVVPTAIHFFFEDKWVESIPMIQAFLLTGFGISFIWLFDTYLLGTGKLKSSLIISSINTISGIVILLLLIDLQLNAIILSFIGRTIITLGFVLYQAKFLLEEKLGSLLLEIFKAMVVFVLALIGSEAFSMLIEGHTQPIFNTLYSSFVFVILALGLLLLLRPDLVKESFHKLSHLSGKLTAFTKGSSVNES